MYLFHEAQQFMSLVLRHRTNHHTSPPLCPHAPSNASLMEPYEVVDNDGDVVTCLPTRTREGQLCFCDDD